MLWTMRSCSLQRRLRGQGVEQQARSALHCIACMTKLKDAGTPWRCNRCRQFRGDDQFAVSDQVVLNRRVCKNCIQSQGRKRATTKQCNNCKAEKGAAHFTKANWERSRSRICTECMEQRMFSNCKKLLNRQCFFHLQLSKPDSRRRCFQCDKQRCSQCNLLKFKNAFTLAA